MAQIFYNRLPRGLHLVQNENGTASILGVPDDLPGYYRFSIRCEDSNKNIAIRDYEIEVVWTDDFNSNTIQRYTLNTSGTASPIIDNGELDFTVSNDSHSSLTYKDRQDLKNGEVGVELSEADDTGIVIAFINDSDYYAVIVYDASSAIISKRNTIELIKKTGSTYSSPLATSSIDFTRGTNHTFHATIDNGIITAFFDNVEAWNHDTGSINLQGAIGPRANRSPSIFDKFWYRTQDMISFLDGDYPQPPLDLAINGYVPSSWAYNDYESSSVELIGTPPFILETDNLPPTYSAVVNGNYVEISGPPLPKGDYTFKLIAKDSSNNTAILPVTMQMLAMEWTMEEIVDDSVEIIGGNGIFVGVFLYGGSLPNGVTYSLDGTNIKLSGKPSGLVDKDRGSAIFKVIDSDNEETLVKIGWELDYDVEWKPIHMDNAPKIWVGHESDIVDDFGVCSEIENKGTLGGIFSQTTNANRPAILYESDIGIRALRFDGSNDYIQGESGFNWISLLSGVENAWSFTTYKSDTTTATNRYPFRINHTSNTNIRYSSIASDTSYANRPGVGGRSQVSPMDNYSSIYAGITVGNDWTTSFQRIDYLNKTGYVRVNGGNEASNILSNMTADVSQNVTSSVPYIGSFSDGYFSGDISQVIFGTGEIKQYDIDRTEGYSMHVSGLNGDLPSNHPFRHVPPYTGTPKLNFDNNEGNLVYGFITTSDNGNVGVSKGDDNFGTFFNDGPMLGVGENFSLIYTDSTLLIFESSDIDSTVNEVVLYDYKGLKLATIPLSYSGGTVYGTSGYELKEDEIYYVKFNSVEYDLEDHYVNENDDSYVNENEDFYSKEGVGSSGTLTISGQLQEWIVGLPVLDTLTVSGGSGQYTSVTVLSGSMPNGVSLQLELDQIKFVGIPLEPSSGSLTISVLDDIGNYGETLLEISVVPMGNIFVGGTFW